MNYLYHCFYAKVGAEKIEQMTLPASDPITALTVFHATMQREHKLSREDYQLLRFHQNGYSDYDFPTKNPEITDDIINRFSAASRRRFLPPAPSTGDEKPTVDAGKAAGHRAG